MRICAFVIIAATAAGCYPENLHEQVAMSDDLDKNGVKDINQAVVVADGPEGAGTCTVLYKPVQSTVSCEENWPRGYGGGAYEEWDDEDTNWESGFGPHFESVTRTDGTVEWCGVELRLNQEYRITAAAEWAEIHDRDGWSDHKLGTTGSDLEMGKGWVDIRSEGGPGCFFEAANIVFGCDLQGKAYHTEGANLGVRDPNCGDGDDTSNE